MPKEGHGLDTQGVVLSGAQLILGQFAVAVDDLGDSILLIHERVIEPELAIGEGGAERIAALQICIGEWEIKAGLLCAAAIEVIPMLCDAGSLRVAKVVETDRGVRDLQRRRDLLERQLGLADGVSRLGATDGAAIIQEFRTPVYREVSHDPARLSDDQANTFVPPSQQIVTLNVFSAFNSERGKEWTHLGERHGVVEDGIRRRPSRALQAKAWIGWDWCLRLRSEGQEQQPQDEQQRHGE